VGFAGSLGRRALAVAVRHGGGLPAAQIHEVSLRTALDPELVAEGVAEGVGVDAR
jgi:hypothetical protein